MQIRTLAAVAVTALVATAAMADHMFIMPSKSNFSGQLPIVQIDAAGSDHLFQFDHRPIQLDQVKVWRPDGSEAPAPQGITSRYRSTFDLRLDVPGTWKITSVTTMVGGTAKVGGEERRVSSMRMGPRPGGPSLPPLPPAAAPRGPAAPEGERRLPPILLAELPADATDLKLTEMVSRTEAFVTAGEPTHQPAGDPRGITLQPITNPTDLVVTDPARFKLLIDGQPAAGLKMALIPGGVQFRNDDAAIPLTADAQGIVTIRWPAPGYYLLTATAEDGKAVETRATMRRLSYGVTLEVAAP